MGLSFSPPVGDLPLWCFWNGEGLACTFMASPAAGPPSTRRLFPWHCLTSTEQSGQEALGCLGPPLPSPKLPLCEASGVCLWALTEGEGGDIRALLGGFKAFLMSMVRSWTSRTPSRTRCFICSTVCAGAGTGLAHGLQSLAPEVQRAGRGPALCYESFSCLTPPPSPRISSLLVAGQASYACSVLLQEENTRGNPLFLGRAFPFRLRPFLHP